MLEAKPMTKRPDYSGKPATAEQEVQFFRPGPIWGGWWLWEPPPGKTKEEHPRVLPE